MNECHLIKRNLGRLLVHVDIFEERAIHVVRLLFDDGAKLEQLVGHRLVGTLENIHQAA